MIFDFDCEPFVRGIHGRTLGDGPGFQHASELEPQVVMQAPGGMLLDDVAKLFRLRDRALAARLGRLREVPLRTVFVEFSRAHDYRTTRKRAGRFLSGTVAGQRGFDGVEERAYAE